MLTSRSFRFISCLVLAGASSLANAGLIGTTISQCTNTVYYGSVTTDEANCSDSSVQATPQSTTVGAGTEFSIGGTRFFDFGADSLSIQYVQPVNSDSPDLIIFTFANPISGITLDGTNALDVTWTFRGNKLGVLINSPWLDGTTTLRFEGGTQTDVPEPGSLALIGLGLLGLARANRRRTSAR